MKLPRILTLFFALLGSAVAAFAADPTGTWKWTTHSPAGEINTTLKLESKDGKLVGAYSNQFGDTTVKDISLKDDVIAFDVVRDLGGNKFVVKYHGKLEGDAINGTIEATNPDGGEPMKLDWKATRAAKE